MALYAMSESSLLQLEQYFNSNSYREYSMNKTYVPKKISLSTHRYHSQQPSHVAYHQLLTNQKSPLTLDRIAYKLRMKSDLNVNTLQEPHIRRYPRPNPIINDTYSTKPPPSATRKTLTRQPTALTMKTLIDDEINGIEGNAVRVGTLDDLIKQFHRAEFRLERRPADYLHSATTYLTHNLSTNERFIPKAPLPLSERVIKQPQALTEYRFNAPISSHTPSQIYQVREKLNNIDLPSLTDQRRQPTAISSYDKRMSEKSSSHTEKPIRVCKKFTIIDPFNSDKNESRSRQTSTRYIFPPTRPFRYFTRKAIDDNQRLTPLAIKKKYEIRKKVQKVPPGSFDSLNQIANDGNSSSRNDNNKSVTSVTDLDDDLHNPPNTKINMDVNNDTNNELF